MEIKCSVGELRERSLMIAVPMYGGVCHGSFTKSLMEFMVLATKYGLNVRPHFIFNESLITRARNYLVDEFMRSGMSRLLFIDSDIGFNAEHIIHMLALQTDESEYDVLCGLYPKKTIAWEKVKTAVDKGLADEDPAKLENYIGDFVFNPLNRGKNTTIRLDEPVEVLESGTGFMMIRRSAFEKYDAKFGDSIRYRPDHVRTKNFDGSNEISMYFQAEIDPETKRYLSEDYLFCQNLRKAGGKVWIAPWVALTHSGTYTFTGTLKDLAEAGVSATASKTSPKK